ncbi:hypothetical protein GGX14DRAFT_453179, partial [Mycena pura]
VAYSSNVLRPYMEQVDAHAEQQRTAPGPGLVGNGAPGPEGGGPNDDGGGGPGDPGDKRPREEPDGEQSPSKRGKFDPASVAFNESYSLDIKEALRLLSVSLGKPSLPETLWKDILLDRFVDLDVIVANRFATEPDEPHRLLLGDHQLEIKKSKVVSRVSNHGEWILAFRTYERAVNFAFKYRRDELETYGNYIQDLFASWHPSLHHRIINYDRAARNLIGQSHSLLFSDTQRLRACENAHLSVGGIFSLSGSSQRPDSKGKDKRPSRRTEDGEICRNYHGGRYTNTLASDAKVRTQSGSVPTRSAMPRESPSTLSTRFEVAAPKYAQLFAHVEDQSNASDACYLPQHMRGFGWRENEPVSYSRTARYTETDKPLPRPSVIRVDRLESLLSRHPNQPFVHSVLVGLREGFWPWMDTHHSNGYPLTSDNAFVPPAADRERDFISSQRNVEVSKGRFSLTFGSELLPGMYSTPVIAVPKPHTDDLRLMSHQSYGEFAQNTMVDGPQTKGPRLDTMQQFLPALLLFRRQHPGTRVVMWKSDVAEVFRLMPWLRRTYRLRPRSQQADRTGRFSATSTGAPRSAIVALHDYGRR